MIEKLKLFQMQMDLMIMKNNLKILREKGEKICQLQLDNVSEKK